MGSNRSHQASRRSLIQCVFSDHEWSRRVSRPLLTKLGEQCRKEYEKNPVGGRRNGARSAVDYVQCRSQHREGNMPVEELVFVDQKISLLPELTLIAA